MATLDNQDFNNTPDLDNRSQLSTLIHNLEAVVINPDLVIEDRTNETLAYIEKILRANPQIAHDVELAWIVQFSTAEGNNLLDQFLQQFSPGTTLVSQPAEEKAGILDRILKEENISPFKEGIEKGISTIASLVPGGSLFLFLISMSLKHPELKKFKNELLLKTLQAITSSLDAEKAEKVLDFGKGVLLDADDAKKSGKILDFRKRVLSDTAKAA